jgi:hypothetical protein
MLLDSAELRIFLCSDFVHGEQDSLASPQAKPGHRTNEPAQPEDARLIFEDHQVIILSYRSHMLRQISVIVASDADVACSMPKVTESFN